MRLIKNLGTRKSKTDKRAQSWGKFFCEYCRKEVERTLSNGKLAISCSCIKGKGKMNSNFRHGDAITKSIYHPLYQSLGQMNARCYNPKNAKYKRYGKRGIRVCKKWRHDYSAFKIDMLKIGWRKGLTIDRINNDRSYNPNNCRCITKAENNRNTSKTKLNWKAVLVLRQKWKSGLYTKKYLANLYNITLQHLRRIINNKSWCEEVKNEI